MSSGDSASVVRPTGGRALPAFLVLVFLGVSAALLYGSHLHDPLLFDSVHWFSEGNAETLRNLRSSDRYVSRAVAYGLYRLSAGQPEILRAASVGLHVVAAFVLFLLFRRLASPVWTASPATSTGAALALAALFTLHPVQVYAVAYHGQMEIVLATLFAMLMLLAFLAAVEQSSRWLLLASVALYLLAVLSKENLVALPAVALAMSLLLRRPSRALLREIWPWVALCAIIGLWIVARELTEARPARPLGEAMVSAASALGDQHLRARSMITQGYLFFRYLFLWLVPDVRWMSIDLQYPLAPSPFVWPESAGFLAFCLYPIVALALLLRRGSVGLVGFGLLWPWLLFLPELAATRVSEAFVLYRGYPWIGGFLIALVAGVTPWVGRTAVPLFTLACLGLALLANERLSTFRSAQAAWSDAIEKNRAYERRAPGSYRAYLNRGTALLNEGRPQDALRDFTVALELGPELPYASLDAALAYIQLGRYAEALRALDDGIARAGALPAPARAAAYSNRAGLYLLLDRRGDALEDLARAAGLDPARAEYLTNLERLRAESEAKR